MISSKTRFTTIVAGSSLITLLFLRSMMRDGFLLFDRLFTFGGVVQICAVVAFVSIAAYHMYDLRSRAVWRQRVWLIFGLVFFLQLLLGIVVDNVFLLNEKLHFPVPSVIMTGAINRFELGFMPILFLATVVLTGGAWCSYLCYFGAFDSVSAGSARHSSSPRFKYRLLFLSVFVAAAIGLRIFGASATLTTIVAAFSGVLGVAIVLLLSRRERTMVHCSYFCPLGTLVSLLKFISPFRYRISRNCTQCMGCTTVCRYGALSKENVARKKLSIGCTSCGDCLAKCRHNGLEYRLLWFSSPNSEKIFLGIVLILYSMFLCVARV